MGIIIDKKVNKTCRLGVWEIEENYEELLSHLKLDSSDLETVKKFRNYKRKLEWLSVRVLLNKMTQKQSPVTYNQNRKPFLKDNSHHISISHSDRYTTVLISDKHDVGIDIEKMKPKIEHIAEKFLKPAELANIDAQHSTYHLYLHWCAKEALYKLCDKKLISLKKHITIEPFHPLENGTLYGKVHTDEFHLRIPLYYFHIHNYSVVWCYKNSTYDL